jgi:hypothetical protein
MSTDYFVSHFRKLDTKGLVRVAYSEDEYSDKARDEAVAELKRRGEYTDDIMNPILKEIRQELHEQKAHLDEQSKKPPSKGAIVFVLTLPALIAILQYFSSPYWRTVAYPFIIISTWLVRSQYWKYLGLGLLINAVVYWFIFLVFH